MHQLPTIRRANLLYTLSIMSVVTIGAAMQTWSISWGLIATELLLILLPTLLFLRLDGLSPSKALRLRWPGVRLAALSLLIGAGIWPLSVLLDVLSTLVLGYTSPLPPDFFPTTSTGAVLFFIALAVSAPICEEVLFRGYLQRAYERRGPPSGVLVGGLLFAFYHVRFQGLLSLLPIALALGYLAWRSQSLVTSMLAHFAVNSLAVASSLLPNLRLAYPSSPALMVGITLALVGLWLFRRITVPPMPPPVSFQPAPWLAHDWPLIISALIYVAFASMELVIGRFPELLTADALELQPVDWRQSMRWTYELRNIVGEPVGEARCQMMSEETALVLDCRIHRSAFEVQVPGSYFNMAEMMWQQTTHWRQKELDLLSAEGNVQQGKEELTLALSPAEDGLTLSVSRNDERPEELALPPNVLLPGEWPWRLSALPFDLAYGGRAILIQPDLGEESMSREVCVLVRGAEPVWTPAGNFVAWKVTMGGCGEAAYRLEAAWYDVETPHTLVRYDDTIVSYLLVEVE
jgi:membrane protease YdiL (CAAX protease family)